MSTAVERHTTQSVRRTARPIALALLLSSGLVAATADAAASRIYRTVDEDGNVVFTDVPPRPEQQGDAVDVETPNSFTPPATASERRSVGEWLGQDGEPALEDGEEPAIQYRSLRVASPTHDEALRDNAGNVTVAAAVEPNLGAGHAIQLYLDGELRQTGPTTAFQLVNVDRGTHNLQLKVVDQTGTVLIASEPTVFHLQRRSVLLQPARRASN